MGLRDEPPIAILLHREVSVSVLWYQRNCSHLWPLEKVTEVHTHLSFALHLLGYCCLEKGLWMVTSPGHSRRQVPCLFYVVPPPCILIHDKASPAALALHIDFWGLLWDEQNIFRGASHSSCCHLLTDTSPQQSSAAAMVPTAVIQAPCSLTLGLAMKLAAPIALETARPRPEEQEQETSGIPRTRALLLVPWPRRPLDTPTALLTSVPGEEYLCFTLEPSIPEF